MSKASRVKRGFDVAAEVLLRDIADGTELVTAIETSVSLSQLKSAFWHNNEIPHGTFTVSIHVTATDATTGNETYVLDVLVDDVAAMNDSPVSIGSITLDRTKGPAYYEINVDSKTIENLDLDNDGVDKFIAIRATLGGTTPIITYGAWISKFLAG